MKTASSRPLRLALAVAGTLVATVVGRSQFAYSVDRSGDLFRLDLANPTVTTTIGNLGFVPEGIDFRSGTSTLYAIDVGANVAQLYTINIGSGAATPIGAGFATAGTVNNVSYNLAGATSFGFDFNPTTLQADGSIRIRFTTNTGANLRLHSATGGIAAVDGNLAGGIGAVGYINNAAATQGGATSLFDVDFGSDTLALQNPPNAGTLVPVGPLGVDVGPAIGFDIFTDPLGGGNVAYLVNSSGAGGSTLYSVNLASGAATPLAVVARDFSGGLAIGPASSAVPEPATYGLLGAVGLLGAIAYRRRMRRTSGADANAPRSKS